MNKREFNVIKKEAERFMSGLVVEPLTAEESAVKVTLPMTGIYDRPLYFFVVKRKAARRFSLILHVESIGINAVEGTLSILQQLLRTYNLILSQEAVIMEENVDRPLHKRMGTMVQVLLGIDAIRRLWIDEHNRRKHAESQDPKSSGNGADNSSSG